jgi:hypothetical protein
MKKHLILTSLVAISVAGGAHAATDVTFGGDYHLADNTVANVATDLSGAAYQYTYQDSAGATQTHQYNADPTLSDFTYTDKDGNAANLSSGTPSQSDYTSTSVADGTTVITTQDIVSGATVSKANYSYVGGDGATVQLGSTPRDMTETVNMDSTYASGHSIDVTNGTATGTISGAWYTYTAESGSVYHLSDDGTTLLNVDNAEQTPDSGSALETAFIAMRAAYDADTDAVATAVTTTHDNYAAETANFDLANNAFTTDTSTVATLDERYGTLVTAQNLLEAAQANQSVAQEAYNADDVLQTAARAVFDSPIETTITDGANDAIDASVAGGSIKTAVDGAEQNAKDYADSLADNYDAAGAAGTAEANAKAYADGLDAAVRTDFAAADSALQSNIDAEATARENADTLIRTDFAAADSALQSNIDAEATARENADTLIRADFAAADSALQTAINNEIARATAVEDALRSEFAAADALTLKSANAYTDKKVSDLEDNMSAGIASSTALSSVAVSGVRAGEVSVGGGYGYYNSKSAFALGMAMGLTNNLSINAGAGLGSNGDNIAFRAGANYKFKLF